MLIQHQHGPERFREGTLQVTKIVSALTLLENARLRFKWRAVLINRVIFNADFGRQ